MKAGYVRTSACPKSVRRRSARRGRAPDQRSADRIFARLAGIEDENLPTCRELGIGVTAYGVLSRGPTRGHWRKGSTGIA